MKRKVDLIREARELLSGDFDNSPKVICTAKRKGDTVSMDCKFGDFKGDNLLIKIIEIGDKPFWEEMEQSGELKRIFEVERGKLIREAV